MPQPQRFDELQRTKLSALTLAIIKMANKYDMTDEDMETLTKLVDAEQDKLSSIRSAMSEILSKL